MKRLKDWDDDGKYCLFYYAQDNSDIHSLTDKIDGSSILISNDKNPVNLGLHRYNNRLFTSNYVGICRLKNFLGNNILVDGKEVILQVEPRFSLSIVELLNYIKDDDEFDRYLAPQTSRYNAYDKDIESLSQNEVFHFFENELPIKVEKGFAMSNSIITISVFLTMLKNLCKRPLMGRMIKKEENLVCKIKGKIVFNKNIKNNTLRGRNDRFYCQYSKYSENIIENQILKQALIRAKRFLNEYFGVIKQENNSFIDTISFCSKSFKHISDVNLSSNECSKLKFSGCYIYYKPVIQVAKMILDGITIEASGKIQISNYVIPYAISMEKLFEIYVRAYLKQNGILSYKKNINSGIQLDKFDEKLNVFNNITNNKELALYIKGNIKPDIVLRNLKTKKVTIFEVKYKNYKNTQNARYDRLQLLAYSMMYDAENVGIIFPSEGEEENYIFKNQLINTYQSKDINYHQMLLTISKNNTNNIAQYIKEIASK